MLRRHYGPKMILVRVSATATENVFAYIGNGRFIYKVGGAVGFWKKAVLPEPPSSEMLREALSG